ncbi:hypothetical protein A7D00_1646 [Trichophyton violaceum]|uniref:Nitrogen regulatory protein areA GATA-like domain-containing protein n=1 Tax=Trichophyton violaceum TaxID=34388 RepID=A0A178FNF1_TRIVO|nr:hypothetical protein A7D00_1646 [Trichophyton violaceum]
MTEALPHGIVFNTHSIRSELNHDSHVEVEDVARLWRVYTTNKTTLEKDAGRRLENLFWRIWSNGRISCTIRGYTLASLFIQISEGEYTTEEWLRKERELAGLKPRAIPHGFYVDNSLPKSPSFQGPSRSNSSRLTSSGSSIKTTLPPSILKKPRPPSDEQLPDSPSRRGVTASYSGDSLYQQSDRSRSGSIRRKKTTFASNLTCSQEMDPGSLPRKINRPFPTRTLDSPAELRPQSPPSKFRGPFDDSPAQSPTSRPNNPAPSSLSRKPQFRSPFATKSSSQPQQKGSYTAQEGNLTANIRMSSTITAEDKMMLEEYLANSPVVLEDKPSSEQPSTASLVEKGFRSRFVKEQVKVKEQCHRVSSLTNLIDSVQPGSAPVPNTFSSSTSSTSSKKSKPKSKHSPTPSTSSTHSTTGNDNSNNRPSPTRAVTAPSPSYASSSTRRTKK